MPPLVTDINLSVDDKFLYVSCWGMGEALAGGPQMAEVSRGGKRIYLTNSLYGSWDDQFYPDGVGSWFAKIDTDPAAGGGLRVDEKFFPRGEDFRGRRVHQVRLGGGDASSDSYCYPS